MKFPDYWGVGKSRMHFNLDADKDGIPDFVDCQPFNRKKKGHIDFETLNSVYRLIYATPQEFPNMPPNSEPEWVLQKLQGRSQRIRTGTVAVAPRTSVPVIHNDILFVNQFHTSKLLNPERVQAFIDANQRRPPQVQPQYRTEIAGRGRNQQNAQMMKSFTGAPLTYEYTTTAYDVGGHPIGNVRVGRDANGRLCIEDGAFIQGQEINGEIIYFYQTHNGVIGIKQK